MPGYETAALGLLLTWLAVEGALGIVRRLRQLARVVKRRN